MATLSSTLSPPPPCRCSNGILTFFFPTEANLQRLDTFCSEETNYAVYGEAVCQHTKLPLIHVVFKLKKRCSITTVQKILGDGKQCGFRPFSEMGVLEDPESSRFAPKYAKKGDQTEIEWETHGDNGPNFGLNYKGKEFHEWLTMGARTDLKRKEEEAGGETAVARAAGMETESIEGDVAEAGAAAAAKTAAEAEEAEAKAREAEEVKAAEEATAAEGAEPARARAAAALVEMATGAAMTLSTR